MLGPTVGEKNRKKKDKNSIGLMDLLHGIT
jgi:hypothetical protein